MRTIQHNFSRNCPTCDKIIWYNSKSSLTRSGNKSCQSCFITNQWAKKDSPLRKEETRLKRNKSISNKRQDPNSLYNTSEYKIKQSTALKKIRTTSSSYTSDEYKEKQSLALKKVWQTETYRSKRLSTKTLTAFSEKMRAIWKERHSEFVSIFRQSWNNENRKEEARKRFNELLESEDFRKKLWGARESIRVSKLELKVKSQLENLGFKHSSNHKTYFNRCLPDFINESSKTIVEIYGDYWHCNPYINKPYSNPDWFHPKLKMFSSDKWAADYTRSKMLEEHGYKVIIFWENEIEINCYNIEKLMI